MAFKLRIFESEKKEIEDFVQKYPNIETGGDLFGLWNADGDPVVQLIIGPGKNCRRTSVSFHQDTSYLATVGTFVNTQYMLCHIGSWHSHHQLSLSKPSAGDRSTVCNNFPEGLQRYIMIIANIERGYSGRHSVSIHPYMFTRGGHVCELGDVRPISKVSPFRDVGYVLRCLAQGSEQRVVSTNEEGDFLPEGGRCHRPSTQSKPAHPVTINYHTNSTNEKAHSPMEVDPPERSGVNNHHPSTRSKLTHQVTGHSYINSTNEKAHSPMEVDPPERYGVIEHQPSTQSKQKNQSTNARKSLHKDINKVTQWYDTEEGGSKLKEIHQELVNNARNIGYHRDAYSKDLTIQFSHNDQKWLITFPASFDNDPAIIHDSRNREDTSSKNVIKGLRKACKCAQCRSLERDCSPSRRKHPHSPSTQNHQPPLEQNHPSIQNRSPSRSRNHPPSLSRQNRPPSPSRQKHPPSPSRQKHPPSRQDHYSSYPKPPKTGETARSPTLPWYETTHGKAIVQRIKTDIETHFEGAGKVTTRKSSSLLELSFDHDNRKWTIKLLGLSKDMQIINGMKHVVAKLSPVDGDVVREIKQRCPCSRCRSTRRTLSGQRRPGSGYTRPNSRYAHTAISNHTPSRRSAAPDLEKFFATTNGEKKFKTICLDIGVTFLNGGSVNISRQTHTKDVIVTFEHNHKEWNVQFPYTFPDLLPTLSFCYLYEGRHSYPIEMRKQDDLLRKIIKTCLCFSCKKYTYSVR